MSEKFRLKLKITGFELEIEGTRDEIPVINQAIGNQISGLLTPISDIVEGDTTSDIPPDSNPPAQIGKPPSKRRSRPQRAGNTGTAKPSNNIEPIFWEHNVAKWGTPKQEWTTANKAIWLLYVLSEEKVEQELDADQITVTFNNHFKVAKTIQKSNVIRDLKKAKSGKDALVTEINSKISLTQVGMLKAKDLVKEALGQKDDGVPN